MKVYQVYTPEDRHMCRARWTKGGNPCVVQLNTLICLSA